MITKNDCLSILVKLEDSGVIEVDPYIKKLLLSRDIPLEVLKFISDNRGIEVSNFYEVLRKSHNQKKSPLYTNIIRGVTEEADIVTTLSSLLTQVLLYSKKINNKDLFFKEVRAEEITRVLSTYFTTGMCEDCKNLLNLIKSDLLVLEYIAGRRELAA